MNDTRLDDILSAEGAVLTDPGQIERGLAVMWASERRREFEESDTRVATRICVGNLVVVGRTGDWHCLSQSLGQLSTEHPARTIVLLVEPGDEAVRASVSAICHVPRPGRPQVCCEQIVLRAAGDAVSSAGRTLLPMLEADVPLAVWWTLEPPAHRSMWNELRSLSDRFVVDAGFQGLVELAGCEQGVVRDLGWYRTARWRELAAHAFDRLGSRAVDRIERVEIGTGPMENDRVDGVWCIAFLAGQLGWKTDRKLDDRRFAMRSNNREVSVQIESGTCDSPGLESLRIDAGNASVKISRCGASEDECRVVICDEHGCDLPRAVKLGRPDPARALVPALTGRLVDHTFERAVPVAVWFARSECFPGP